VSNYRDVIYGKDDNNDYPSQFCKYLVMRFFNTKGSSLLDVGCSGGTHMKYFAQNGITCKGVDLRDENVKGFEVRGCNIETETIPFNDNIFDYVFSKSLAEHVHNTDNFFSNVLRVLKPGGIFVCMTPDWKSQASHFWDDYTHIHPFTRKSLRNALTINGFIGADCEYFYQLPFVWKCKFLEIAPIIINAVTTQNMKWKNRNENNGEDNKLIRFSKEKMLLSYAFKGV